MNKHKAIAEQMLAALDGFTGGNLLTSDEKELRTAVMDAGAFAGAAFEAVPIRGGNEYHALTRAFLLALIDPLHPDLDYLRSDPKSGDVARLVTSDLAAIVADEEGE